MSPSSELNEQKASEFSRFWKLIEAKYCLPGMTTSERLIKGIEIIILDKSKTGESTIEFSITRKHGIPSPFKYKVSYLYDESGKFLLVQV